MSLVADIGGGRWSKVGGLAAKNAKLIIHEYFYFPILGTFSAIGEATICLELSRAL